MDDEDGGDFEEEIYGEESDDDEGGLTKEQVSKKIENDRKIIEKYVSLSDEFKMKLQANAIADKQLYNKSIRNDRKTSYSFVFTFGILNKLYFDPYLLAQENNMTKKELNSCLKVIAGNDTKKKPENIIPVHIFHPRDFVLSFVNSGNILEEDVPIIIQKVEEFYDKYYLFLESVNPRHTLAYVIKKYYTQERNPPLEKIPGTKTFTSPFSKVTLKEIEQIVLNDLTVERINPEYPEKSPKKKEEEDSPKLIKKKSEKVKVEKKKKNG